MIQHVVIPIRCHFISLENTCDSHLLSQHAAVIACESVGSPLKNPPTVSLTAGPFPYDGLPGEVETPQQLCMGSGVLGPRQPVSLSPRVWKKKPTSGFIGKDPHLRCWSATLQPFLGLHPHLAVKLLLVQEIIERLTGSPCYRAWLMPPKLVNDGYYSTYIYIYLCSHLGPESIRGAGASESFLPQTYASLGNFPFRLWRFYWLVNRGVHTWVEQSAVQHVNTWWGGFTSIHMGHGMQLPPEKMASLLWS